MMELKTRSTELEDVVDLSYVVGKPVISRDGQTLGHVDSFFMDPQTYVIEGVLVDRGFLKDVEFVGREYIKSIARSGVVLNIAPVTEVIGQPVYDARGKNIGSVGSVQRKRSSNRIKSIEVKRGWFKKTIQVPRHDIKRVGKGVMLSVPVRG